MTTRGQSANRPDLVGIEDPHPDITHSMVAL